MDRIDFQRRRVIWLAVLVTGLTLNVVAETPGLTEAQRDFIAFESLSRLQTTNLTGNPALKSAVSKLLDKTRGTPQFLRIVKQFNLADQDEGLLALAQAGPGSDAGVEAIRVILGHDNTNLLTRAFTGTNAVRTAEALGNSKEKKAVPLLLTLVSEDQADVALRKQAVKSLAQTSEGANGLITLAKAKRLREELNATAAAELNASHWAEVKAEAGKVLPLATGSVTNALPPAAELLKMSGDAARGKAVFLRASPGCATCHRIKGEGAQVGPDLSEIGTKLGKDAILEAILNPSAGISVGYETYELQLKSGDEAYGLIVSDAAEEVAIKDGKGIVTRYKKSEIASRRQLKTSLMPTGLQAGMTTQELLDLVEFLAGLRK